VYLVVVLVLKVKAISSRAPSVASATTPSVLKSRYVTLYVLKSRYRKFVSV